MLKAELSTPPPQPTQAAAGGNTAIFGTWSLADHRLEKASPEVSSGKSSKDDDGGDVQGDEIGKKLSSRYRGVCWNKKNRRWQAAINSSGKYLYLGSYVSEEDAARAFDRAAIRIRGKKARINFKFEDYENEDLEGWHNELHSKDPKDNRTKASKAPYPRRVVSQQQLPELTLPGVPVLSGVPTNQRDFGFAGSAIGSSPTKTVGLGAAFADTQAVRSPSYLSGVADVQDSRFVLRDNTVQTGQAGPEQMWNHVLEVTPQEDCGMQGQVLLTANPNQDEHKASNLYPTQQDDQNQVSGQTFLSLNLPEVEITNQQPVLVLPNAAQANAQPPVSVSDTATASPSGGFGSSFSAGATSCHGQDNAPIPPTGDGGQMNPPTGDVQMSPLPSDSTIFKIIPFSTKVFGVLYTRPGCSGTGTAVWDSRNIHDMGMYSTQSDAQQACTAGMNIIVRLSPSLLTQSGSQGNDEQVVLTALTDNENLGAKDTSGPNTGVTEAAGSNRGVTTGRGDKNPERQAPQTSPFVGINSSHQNLIRMLSIGSEDLNKYLGQHPAGTQEMPQGGASDQGKGLNSVADLVKHNNGNLGSLLHWDSFNSSLLNLLKHNVPGNNNSLTGKGEGQVEASVKQDAEGGETAGASSSQPASFSAVMPSWIKDFSSITELGSITLRESRNLSWLLKHNEDCYLFQQPGGNEACEGGVSEAQRNAASNEVHQPGANLEPAIVEARKDAKGIPSIWRHNTSSDYDEVVNWFVSRPQEKENDSNRIIKGENASKLDERGGLNEQRQSPVRVVDHVLPVGSIHSRWEHIDPAAADELGHVSRTKRKGPEFCGDQPVIKRARSPC